MTRAKQPQLHPVNSPATAASRLALRFIQQSERQEGIPDIIAQICHPDDGSISDGGTGLGQLRVRAAGFSGLQKSSSAPSLAGTNNTQYHPLAIGAPRSGVDN